MDLILNDLSKIRSIKSNINEFLIKGAFKGVLSSYEKFQVGYKEIQRTNNVEVIEGTGRHNL